MMHPTVDFKEYLRPGVRVHLSGIGGVSMCPLAEVLLGMGLRVQGSDMSESDTVRHLRSLGIPVAVGHSADNLQNAQLVIRTAAIHDDNPEVSGAIARGIPVYERAQAWEKSSWPSTEAASSCTPLLLCLAEADTPCTALLTCTCWPLFRISCTSAAPALWGAA